MTASFRQYWVDVRLPSVAAFIVTSLLNLMNGDLNSIIGSSGLAIVLIMTLRLMIEPIHAAQRKRVKEIMNYRYGGIGK